MESYKVRPLKDVKRITVSVPGSKSVTNRALLLAAMGNGVTKLNGVLFSDDSRAFLNCLKELGFFLNIDEKDRTVTIKGTSGNIPNKKATINVGSAGTAARFLTVFLAFAGGEYTLNASAQMCKRPMEPLISALRNAGISILCTGEEGHFPFTLNSAGVSVKEMRTNTDVSSQFASAMLMAAPLLADGLNVILEGSRTNGSYINITLNMMKQFGYKWDRCGDTITVKHNVNTSLPEYDIEPDVSASGYFYAMSPISNKEVLVKGVHLDCMQGDIKFVNLLSELGCTVTDTDEGVLVLPPALKTYNGIDVNMKDFSDQTMTMASVAAFADTETNITGINHIQFQESDRLHAIINELNRVGAHAEEIKDSAGKIDGIKITPPAKNGGIIETYEDHRMAMAFSLIGLRINNIEISNPMCCAKTFENYFEVLDSICIE